MRSGVWRKPTGGFGVGAVGDANRLRGQCMSWSIETAFLPAALEIQETRLRRRVGQSCGPSWPSLPWLSFGRASVRSILSPLPRADHPSGHSKTVQPLEIGTVTAIHVADGQRVAAGEVIIELDPTGTRADVERLTKERDTVAREVARCKHLSDWLQLERRRPNRKCRRRTTTSFSVNGGSSKTDSRS
ncbi:MAG: biotin/lipoyl-binding protein [Chromatiaceae bacterium]|nr:biotin/lipoyl-binding protein [Chromatiaceae bacterium]